MHAVMKNSAFLKCSGFSLLEVLIAVVILAIGLLGLAGLQATGIRSNHSAYLRTQATLQSYDIIDRMRANSNADYNNITAAQTAACTGTAGCTPQEMAQNDVFDWNAANGNILPSGAGVVCIDNTPDDGDSATNPACDNIAGAPFAVKIWWVDDREGNVQRFVTSFRP